MEAAAAGLDGDSTATRWLGSWLWHERSAGKSVEPAKDADGRIDEFASLLDRRLFPTMSDSISHGE